MISTLTNLLQHTDDDAQADNQNEDEQDLPDCGESPQFDASDHDHARELIAREQERAEQQFEKRWYDEWDREDSIAMLNEWHGWRTIDAILETVEVPQIPTFHVDSLLLADCFQELFREPSVESFVYLTGQQIKENQWTLNRCVPIEHAVQSSGGAEADPDSAIDTLVELDEVDHRLLGHAHNHPGTGVGGVTPSGTDLTYQQELEEGGYTAVGLVMTQDGHARFFTDTLEVSIEVYGSHINPIDNHENTFKLSEPARTASQRLASA